MNDDQLKESLSRAHGPIPAAPPGEREAVMSKIPWERGSRAARQRRITWRELAWLGVAVAAVMVALAFAPGGAEPAGPAMATQKGFFGADAELSRDYDVSLEAYASR